jgi:hypothetical protein
MATGSTARSAPPVALLTALLDTWRQACVASAQAHEARRAALRSAPQPWHFAAPRPGGEALTLDLAELCRSPWLRPKDLALAFEVELKPRRGGGWALAIAVPHRWWHGPARRRHRVAVRITGHETPRAQLFFDGQPWRTLEWQPVPGSTR